nr:asparagine synthase (glutamine-hydrolyzing) [Candidatus Woesebacteria bacterium]
MCGIAGFTGKKNEQLIQQMSTDMKHRGPDGDGFYIDEHVSLLNRRLAIIDRAGGDQPIYNEDKTIAVVYNGEIYNYLELRDTLKKAGHVFKTKSDTEVIVHGYEEWGNDCFDYFNGMFGIALYDIPKKKLILARDHFGIKPIYYAHTEKGLIFASEIKPILRSGYIEKKVNDRILYRYLAYRIHDDQEETFFEGVYHLMPGQMLTVENNNISKHIFSTLEKDIDRSIDQKNSQSLMHADIKKFKELFIDSIQRRLIAEVPVGTCLSGGLDSSSVVTVVNKLLSEHAKESESVGAAQNTFSAVFPGSTN